jgi:hypothetical protein
MYTIMELSDNLPQERPMDAKDQLTNLTSQLLKEVTASLLATSKDVQHPRRQTNSMPSKNTPTLTPTKLSGRLAGLLPALTTNSAPGILPIWHNFIAAATELDCPILTATTILPPVETDNADLKTWAAAVLPTTSQVKAFCQTATVNTRSPRFKQARAELNSIFLEAIIGTGRLSPFLKKALHPIHRILKHTQIDPQITYRPLA